MGRPSFDEAVEIARRHSAILTVIQQLRDGKPLSREQADWLADRLEHGRERHQQQGPGRPRMRARDLAIVDAIKDLEARGLKPTRNKPIREPHSDGGSACDAVGVAFGIDTYGNVERVWLKFRKWEKRPIPDADLEWIGITNPRKPTNS